MKKKLFLERKSLPKEIKQAMMELIDRGFSQKITDEHTNLRLFTTNFTPVISTKRIIPRMRWLELVYAMPYLVLKREIFNSFKKTKTVLTSSAKQIWNIFMHLEFPLSRYEDITTRLHRFSREIMKIQARSKIQVKPVSSPYVNLVKSCGFYFKSSSLELARPVSRETATTGIETEKESAVANYQLPVVIHQPPVVSHKPSAVSYKTSDAAYRPYGHLEREVLQNEQKIISYFDFKSSSMELAQPVSRETATTGLETEKESAVANYQLTVVIHQPPVVSHKSPAVRYEDLATYILTSTSDFITPLFSYYSFKPVSFLSRKTVPVKQRGAALILQKSDTALPPYGHLERETLQNGQRIISYFNFKTSSMELAQPVSHETSTSIKPTQPLNQKISAGEVEIEKNIYHTYPKIEHVASTHTEIIKERVIEKEEESKPPQVTPQLPSIDVNRIADQVYSFIERKIRIEKERRGL